MTLATKNGALILKDGALAENCECCGGLCDSVRSKATITLFGMPSSCRNSAYDNRTLADDNCSYTLFRVRSTWATTCKYATTWHSKRNEWLNFSAYDISRLTLDVDRERLKFIDETLQIEFAPPSGRSFREFPFSGTLVPLYIDGILPSGCTASSFANVAVTIDDSIAKYIPFKCPEPPLLDAWSETCDCVAGIDTVPDLQRASTIGSVTTDTVKVPIYHCAPCESTAYSVDTESYDSATGAFSFASTIPELQLSVSFSAPSVASWIHQLSGTYSLKWKRNAIIGNGNYLGLYGSGNNLLWSNFETDIAEQGWHVDYRMPAQAPFATALGMTIVVVPVKAAISINRATGESSASPCQSDQIAYEIKAAVFRGGLRGIGSAYIYWNWDMSSHAMVPCRQRECGFIPSIAFDQTENITIPTGGSFGNVTTAQVDVRLQMSS